MSAPGPDRIIRMASAFYESCLLFAAADLGVFAELARAGAAEAPTLAAALGLDPRGARLLLDGCVAAGLLAKDDGRYRNTPESAAFLVPGRPGDLTGAIRYNRDVYPAWGRLREFVCTGQPVEPPAVHLGDDPERTRTFVLSMHHRALGLGRAVVPCLRLEGCAELLDVGGGPGTYSVLMAQANPGLRCTVWDLPAVAAIARELVAGQPGGDRVTVRAGSYRADPFPGTYDAIAFFGVLHQEAPDTIANLFRRACAALRPGGRVYVMDLMTDATHTQPAFSALFAVNMALTTDSGWVFSDAELRGWLEGAGLVDFAVQPLPPPMPHWLASARRPTG